MPRKSARTTRDTRWGDGSLAELPERHGQFGFQARWQDGNRRRARTFRHPDRQACQDMASDFLRQVGRDKRSGRYQPPSDLTVDGVVEEYLARAEHRLSPRTVITHRSRAEKMIAPYIGSRRAEAITTLVVQRWVEDLVAVERNGKRRFGASAIHNAISVLQCAFKEAKSLGLIQRNDTVGIRRPRIGHQPSAAWTEEQARRVLQEVHGDERFDALYCTALATGMRPGELRALRWRDVDLERSMIVVRATISRDASRSEVIVDTTKTGKQRTIALPGELVAKLRWHRARQIERRLRATAWHDLDIVFDRGDGHWLYQSGWLKYHDALCQRAGVPRIRHHDLRHTSASLELAAGTHPKIVSDRLGHTSIEITLDRYSHVAPDLQRAAAEALGKRLFPEEPDTTTSRSKP